MIVLIAIVTAFLIPALSPSSARALEGDARNFSAQLANARLMAISRRSKTRVLIASTNDWGTDFSWPAFALASYDSTSGNWLQQGKFYRLSQATTFDSATGIVQARSSSTTAVVKARTRHLPRLRSTSPGPTCVLSNGATSLDPAATPEVITIQDGFVPVTGSSPTPVRKNQNLKSQITIDPLTGNAILQ